MPCLLLQAHFEILDNYTLYFSLKKDGLPACSLPGGRQAGWLEMREICGLNIPVG